MENVEIPPEDYSLYNDRTDAVVLDELKPNNQDEGKDQNEILGYRSLTYHFYGYKQG